MLLFDGLMLGGLLINDFDVRLVLWLFLHNDLLFIGVLAIRFRLLLRIVIIVAVIITIFNWRIFYLACH